MHMSTLKRQWTTDDLRDLPNDGNRYEVIDGELFVTPAPSWKHQGAAAELFRLVAEYLEREPYADVLIAPADVSFSRTRSVQPDLFLVPLVNGQRPDRFEDVGHLLLAVEILSPSTARPDRVSKRVLFRDEGVNEYWVVDLDARTIERSTPADARVDVIVDRIEWTVDGASTSLAVNVPQYFTRVLDG